ncbi:type III-A CRISPR-associated RAMP protein Csm5 [Aureivirga sp. CE67]|uniref:type III-A CRISPR-associated RAMP protein Csm5 n=1 Tax=Aureivirga sp. CE67 TaxID=1788983 RepID=UPI0018CA1E5C|nr:type III-A CRISPR-associated RAMP protein Csm5 [Aureivirga sp. CE67]
METLKTEEKQKIEINTIIPLQITTLSPVCIKSHEAALSPIADYVCDGGKIKIIDSKKFQQLLSDEVFMESYIEEVINLPQQTTDKNKKFLDFLKSHNAYEESLFSKGIDFKIEDNPVQIERHIHSKGKAFIPGSSLKGSIRNAMFYDFYKNKRQQVNSFLKQREDENQRKNPEYHKKSFIINSKQFIKEAEKFFDTKEKNFYGHFSLFGIRDSELLENKTEAIEVYRERYNIGEGELEIPSIVEAISEQTTIKIDFFIKNSKLDKKVISKIGHYDNVKDFSSKGIFKILNQFSKDFINKALIMIENDKLNSYQEQLESYLSMIESFEKENHTKALVCLGFGKSMYQNSIQLAFDNIKGDAIDKIKKEAPTTLFLNHFTGESLGWCIIEEYSENNHTDYQQEILKAKELSKSQKIEKETIAKEKAINEEKERLIKIKEELKVSDISEKQKDDIISIEIVEIIKTKPKKIIGKTLQNNEECKLIINGVKKTENYNIGDIVKVKLAMKEKGIFKQAKLIIQ